MGNRGESFFFSSYLLLPPPVVRRVPLIPAPVILVVVLSHDCDWAGEQEKTFLYNFFLLILFFRQISRRAVVPYLALGDYVGSETGKKIEVGC